MQKPLGLFGNLLFLAGLAGLLLPGSLLALRYSHQPGGVSAELRRELAQLRDALPPVEVSAAAPPLVADAPAAPEQAPALADTSGGVVTRVRMPSIGLDAEVVTASLVQVRGAITWEVPAFKVGHGERTAGAGQPGNAVLLGHVTSLDAGNVFKDLGRAHPGDEVQLYDGEQVYTYRVGEVRSVPRTNVEALQSTDTPTVTLVTCSGTWLPAVQDFSERLIVRAELAQVG